MARSDTGEPAIRIMALCRMRPSTWGIMKFRDRKPIARGIIPEYSGGGIKPGHSLHGAYPQVAAIILQNGADRIARKPVLLRKCRGCSGAGIKTV